MVGQTSVVTESTPYDPATETDPLIQRHITRHAKTGRIVFVEHPYSVGAVVLHLTSPDGGIVVAAREFPELSAEAFRAAQRFAQLHPDEMRVEQEFHQEIQRFVTGELSIDELYDWLSEHVQPLADTDDAATRRLYGLAWLMVSEWSIGDRSEQDIREQVGPHLLRLAE